MSVPYAFTSVTSATGAQLDADFAACAQLNAVINLTNATNWAAPVVIASAATVNIGAAASNSITISGVNTITAFDTITAGAMRFVTYSGAVPITYNVTSMQLVTAASRINVIGDVSIFQSLGAGNWKELVYQPVSGNIVPIATAAEVTTGTNNTKMVTPLAAQGVLGVRTARAWVNFDGTLSGTITPRSAFNVTSVTKNGTGDWTLNFTNALADANYSFSGLTRNIGTSAATYFGLRYSTTPTTTALRMVAVTTGTPTDSFADYICVSIFGN